MKNGKCVDQYGNERWYKDSNLHREDGPAIFYPKLHLEGETTISNSDGFKAWYMEGVIHREGGPAIINNDGTKEWFHKGLRHREDGPAIIWANGIKMWYLRDKSYFSEEWFQETTPEGKLSFLFRDE